jgi:prepilin-type N-terminal cleavage/methylation domain-containing protein
LRRGRTEKGFTLAELTITLGIIAILVGIAALVLTKVVGVGRAETCEHDLTNIQTAVVAYYFQNEGWPTADGEPGDLFWLDGGVWTDELTPGWVAARPDSDSLCDWWVDADGGVCCGPAATDDCHCGADCE